MKNKKTLITALLSGVLGCGMLSAGPLMLNPQGHNDSLSITLDPVDGAVHGTAGSTVGWGFNVLWTSDSGDWIQFTGSDVGSPDATGALSLLAGYTDYIGVQGGPGGDAVSNDPGTWSQTFVQNTSGTGAFAIDPLATDGASESSQLSFFFQIYDGDPFNGGNNISTDAYNYYGTDTAITVTVDSAVSDAPEPSTMLLLGSGGLAGLIRMRRSK